MTHRPLFAQALEDFMDDNEYEDTDDGASINSQYEGGDGPSHTYKAEHGRLYLAEVELLLPSDEDESRRLNTQYFIIRNLFDTKPFFAPVKDPKRILDVGTGTGKWVQHVAEIFPNAEIIGSDIHPHVRHETFPENVEIVCEDASNNDWGDHPYSFIHTRILNGCFTDFREIINRSFKYLEPGGWMESQEVYSVLYCDNDTLKPDDPFLEWTRRLDDAFMKLGKPLRIGNKLKRWYEAAGFVDVKEEVFKLPINEWLRDPKFRHIGEAHRKSLVTGLSAFSLRPFYRAFGWSHDETQIYLAAAKKAISDTNTQAYFNVFVVWGRKPDDAPMTRLP